MRRRLAAAVWFLLAWSLFSRVEFTLSDAEFKNGNHCIGALLGCVSAGEAAVATLPLFVCLALAAAQARRENKRVGRSVCLRVLPVWKMLAACLALALLPLLLRWTPGPDAPPAKRFGGLGLRAGFAGLADDSNVRVPSDAAGAPLSVAERLRLLELKVGSFMNWGKDPWYGMHASPHASCRHTSTLDELGCAMGTGRCPGLYDHRICLDDLPPPVSASETPAPLNPGCVVYDFGIRENPASVLLRFLLLAPLDRPRTHRR